MPMLKDQRTRMPQRSGKIDIEIRVLLMREIKKRTSTAITRIATMELIREKSIYYRLAIFKVVGWT